MYRTVFALGLRRLEPERAHALASRSLTMIRRTAPGRQAVARLAGSPDPVLRTHALGLTFASPLGVAAGLDKGADWYDALQALGFGFTEIGTVTAQPQPGNPMPRIIRFPHQHALLNRMGFPNPGAQAVARRLAARPPNTVVGVNVGKSKAAPAPSTLADYRSSVRQLAPLADYLVVNVSSPNTPGLRDLQAVDSLRPLVAGIRDELTASDQPVPLLVKIAPDLADEDIDAITALALEQGLDGLVAVNTTLDRAGVGNAEAPFEGGGVSGPPLKAKALHVLRRIRATAGDRLTIVSVGGVGTADDVWERLRAGATLVQAYTALVYEGPAWPGRVNRQLAEKVRAAGLDSVQAIVGADAARRSPAYPAHRVH